jgi:16S rRNA (cytidine1402-2'-O)-methyltransferase
MLHIVSTPIGNLKDITLRSIETLKRVDTIVCEDTRVSGVLLNHLQIQKPLIFYNDHNAPVVRPKVLKSLQAGQSIALISDAGMPLISDPGYKLLQLCLEQNIPITVEPGPSAVLTALVYSGFPPHPFFFGGFFDKKFLHELEHINATLIFFESARRMLNVLDYLMHHRIPRSIAVSREMTKKFEETRRGTLEEVKQSLIEKPIKGEVTFCLSPLLCSIYDQDAIDALLQEHMSTLPLKTAAKLIAEITGEKVNTLYKRALFLRQH